MSYPASYNGHKLMPVPPPPGIRVYDDQFPWTADAYDQMFHQPSVTKATDKSEAVIYDV